MNLSVFSAKVTGNPDESGWSQVHEYKPEEGKLEKRGVIFISICLKDIEGVDAVTAGRDVLSKLQDEYYGNHQKSTFETLTNALKEVAEEFKTSVKKNIELVAAVYVNDAIYVAASGGARVYIFRNGILAEILISEGETISASGHPKEDDVLLIGTSGFFKSVSKSELNSALKEKNPQNFAEDITAKIRSQEYEGQCAACAIKFSKDKEFIKNLPTKPVEEKEKGNEIKFRKGLWRRFVERLPERKLYVKDSPKEMQNTEKRRKTAVTVGIIMIILLAVSVVFGVRKQQQDLIKSRYEPRLSEAERKYNESKELFLLDEKRARELFVESQNIVVQLEEEGVEDERLVKLADELNENEGDILGIYNQKAELFVNLSLLSSGFNGDTLAGSLEKIFILDKKGERVAEVDIGSKRSEIVAGPSDLDSPEKIASYSDRVYILEGSSIYELKGENKDEVIENGWSGDVLISSYAGNIYILDKGKNMIYRYTATQNGFSSEGEWIAPGTGVDIKDAKDMAIDGSIWVLNGSSSVSRFLNGVPGVVKFEKLSPAVTTLDAIYTNEELNYLYLLDKYNKRIIVTDKEGKYVAQYRSEDIAEAKNIVVSEEEKIILLLINEKLLSIELKHF